jgi:thymidine phosphorylase
LLGAPHDKYAGIYLLKKLDERVSKNEPILIFHSTDRYKIKEAEITLENFPIYKVE